MNQAYEIPSFYLGIFPADIDMSSEASFQFTAVAVHLATQTTGANGAGLIHPAAGGAIIGIVQNNPALGEAGTVMNLGVSKAQAAATLAIGDILMVNTSGKFLPATTGNYGVAMALQAAANGDIVSVLLQNFGKQ